MKQNLLMVTAAKHIMRIIKMTLETETGKNV